MAPCGLLEYEQFVTRCHATGLKLKSLELKFAMVHCRSTVLILEVNPACADWLRQWRVHRWWKRKDTEQLMLMALWFAFVKKCTFSGFGIIYVKIIINVTAIFFYSAAFCTSSTSLSPVHYSCVFAPCNPCRALSRLSCSDFEVLKLQTERLNLCSFPQTQFAVILQLFSLIPFFTMSAFKSCFVPALCLLSLFLLLRHSMMSDKTLFSE